MNANTTTASVIRTPYVAQALTRHGMVAAILTARVIITAQALWEAERAEESAGGGYSESAFLAAEDDRVAAEEDYHRVLRLAEAAQVPTHGKAR